MLNRFAALAVALAAVGTSAHADLVSVDWKSSGDGLLTYDTNSGLYWLDWTQGLQYSYNDMLGQLGAGGAFAGFHYASEADLTGFMISGGVPDLGGRTSANIPSVENIISLLGANNLYSFLGNNNSTAAFLSNPNGPTSQEFAAFTIETFDNPLTAKAGEIGAGVSTFAFGMGHALVTSVPTPASALVAGMGMLGVARRRRK